MSRSLAGIVLGLAVAAHAAEPPPVTLTYDAFRIGQDGRHPIGHGVRTYSPACDIRVESGAGGSRTKSLTLDGGLAVSASVYREPRLTGFGLTVEMADTPTGFSWDWFDLVEGNVFEKRQGTGRIAVDVSRAGGLEELRAIEFLDDITLRFLDDTRKPPGTHTHEIVVRKGSVLELATPDDASATPCPSTPKVDRSDRAAPARRPPSPIALQDPADDDVQDWLTYYYLEPRPERALSSLDVLDRELQKAGRSLADEVNRGGLRSFYARVFAANDGVVRDLAARMPSLPAGQRAFVREALRRCGTAACKKVVGSEATSAEHKMTDPGTLDDSWASFFATGDARYVREIIEVLPWSEARGDIPRLLTGGAARWSLASNAYQHARVLAIAEESLATASEPTRRLLREIVDQAKEERAKNPPPEP